MCDGCTRVRQLPIVVFSGGEIRAGFPEAGVYQSPDEASGNKADSGVDAAEKVRSYLQRFEHRQNILDFIMADEDPGNITGNNYRLFPLSCNPVKILDHSRGHEIVWRVVKCDNPYTVC